MAGCIYVDFIDVWERVSKHALFWRRRVHFGTCLCRSTNSYFL